MTTSYTVPALSATEHSSRSVVVGSGSDASAGSSCHRGVRIGQAGPRGPGGTRTARALTVTARNGERGGRRSVRLFRRRTRPGVRPQRRRRATSTTSSEFAGSHTGVEAFVEPPTAVVDHHGGLRRQHGEWTRRRVRDARAAHELAEQARHPVVRRGGRRLPAADAGLERRTRRPDESAARRPSVLAVAGWSPPAAMSSASRTRVRTACPVPPLRRVAVRRRVVVRRAGDVQVRPAHALGDELLEEQPGDQHAAVLVAHVRDVGHRRVHRGAQLVGQRHRPHLLAGGARGRRRSPSRRSSSLDMTRRGPAAERHELGAGQRRDVDEHVGLVLAGPHDARRRARAGPRRRC